MMTRRELLAAGAVTVVWAADPDQSGLSMEAYIFQQYAQRQHKKLGEVLAETIPMARIAGFKNIELNGEFFVPALKDKTLELIGANQLRMPSVYSGGVMHEKALAEETIARALEIGNVCQPFGCVAVVTNPSPKTDSAQKTDAELATQLDALNRMGRVLAENGLQLRVHHHTPEMVDNAREWRNILHGTDPKYVFLCMDLDWVHQGGQNPLALLKEAGNRAREIHVRNSKDKLWLEAFEPGDVDYREIAEYLRSSDVKPLIVVELAYRENTVVTRPLAEDLRVSRLYAEKVFGLNAKKPAN